MDDIIKYGKFKKFEKNKKKRQIILCHSFRRSEEYLASIQYRVNGDYDKIPNYFITKDGKILNLISDDSYSNFFDDKDINRNSILICLENYGWLTKLPLNINYTNWIGDIYVKDAVSKRWRGKDFWDRYTDEQYTSLVNLVKKLTKKFSIKNKFIGHNTKVDGVKVFNGIVCRSNYHNRFTDLSPAFDFENFKKNIENEG
jgi:N-acetyl-anhydromuramyl-L-alanine amidase AmpD